MHMLARALPDVTLTVDGVAMRLRHGFKITETANGRNRLDGTIYSPDGTANRPAVGGDVQLVEDGVVIFGGLIDTPTEGGVGDEPVARLLTKFSASDYNSFAERRVMNITFPPGTLKSWLQTVVGYLSHWGVTLDPAQIDGPTFTDPFVAAFMRVDEVLNEFVTLASAAGVDLVWDITYTKHLRMYDPATSPTPFNIADGDRNTIGDVTVAPSIATYATRVLVLAGAGLHDVTETFTGDGTTAAFPLQYYVAATRGYVTNNPPGHLATDPDVNETLGDAPAEWSYDNATSTLTRTVGAPAAGSAIRFIYTAQFPVLKYADAPGGIPDPPGLWEQLVREPDVFDATLAQQHADADVLAASQQLRTVKYRTLHTGVHPGQVQQIVRAARHLNAQCLITDVGISDVDGRTYRDVTAAASTTVTPIDTWRDMIKGWNKVATGASGSPANIVSGGGGGGGSAEIGPGTTGKLAKWTSAATIGDSLITESGSTVGIAGDVTATTYTGSGAGLTNLPSTALTGTIPDARLSANVALKNAALNAFTGNATFGGTLGVTGASTLASLGVTGNTTVGGTLGVTGATTLAGLTAGASTLASLGVTNNATVGGTLGVTGQSTLGVLYAGASQLTSLGVTNIATIGGTLTVTGASTLSSLVVTNNASIGGTFGVTGATTLAGLTAGASTLASLGVTNDATVGGALTVNGATTSGGFTLGGSSPPGPGRIYRDAGNGLVVQGLAGSGYDFMIAQPSGAPIARVVTGTPNLELGGTLGSIGYVSGTTGWRITSTGAAEFRSLGIDTLHVKVFATDQERSLAGGELIAKAVAVLSADVVIPAYGAAVTITVADVAGAPGMPVFVAGDWVQLRIVSRSGGALTADTAYGQVTAPTTGLPGNTQSWTFTRGTSATGGTLAGGATVSTGTLVVDFGVSGSGYYEVQAADGAYDANGPYAQIGTWTTSPLAANRTIRTRFGNLFGITSTANEYGMIAGAYAPSNGQYFRASNTAFELHGIDLVLWNAGNVTAKIDHAVPSFALGNPLPASFGGTTPGVWMGRDTADGIYKFRVGDPSSGGNCLTWNGTVLQITGTIVATAGLIGGWSLSGGALVNQQNLNIKLVPTGLFLSGANGAAGIGVGMCYQGTPSNTNARLWVGALPPAAQSGGSTDPNTQWIVTAAGNQYINQGFLCVQGYGADPTTNTNNGGITALSLAIGPFATYVPGYSPGVGCIACSKTLTTGGTIFCGQHFQQAANYFIYPGSVSGLPANQGSYYIASHASYGLYSNTGLYLAGNFWVAGSVSLGAMMAALNMNGYDINGANLVNCSVLNATTYFASPNGYAAIMQGKSGTAGYIFVGDGTTGYNSDTHGRIQLLAAGAALYWDGGQFFPGARWNLGHPSWYWQTAYIVAGVVTSDARQKTNVRPTAYRTDFLRQIRPVDFEWIDPTMPAGRQHGFIAQEVAALDADFGAVSRDPAGEPTGLNYAQFIPVLVATMQELDARLTALERTTQDAE